MTGPASSAAPARPAAPDALVLEEAASSVRGILGNVGAIEWRIGERVTRPQSTLFLLRAEDAAGRGLDAYYKESYWRETEPSARQARRMARTGAGLERTLELERRLAEKFRGEGITFSRTLAVDPERMIVVTTAVPGKPLGRPARRLWPRSRRAALERWLQRAGRAVWLIEECSDDLGADDAAGASYTVELAVDEPSETRRWEKRIHGARNHVPSSLADEIRSGWRQMLGEALDLPRPVVFAHGDLSSSNILIGEELGLIDFVWVPRLRGFDLAHLAYRLQYDSPQPKRSADSMLDGLMEGYGAPELESSPGWRYHRLGFMLKVLADRGPALNLSRRLLRKRALAEVRSVLG